MYNTLPERTAASRSLVAENMNRDSLYWALMSSIVVRISVY